ncbi:putative membrane protein [[Clostridium] bifermentans ATCC 638]|uniref:Putative membrane protein n=1 Tax=Paraclostridium bifermentans ATCC 638 = DSM 14991 TaxID=1233171 RepID=T4VFT1_PARBF|nr:hypothetical protein [Paraclostridium bifermentans]EQK39975.1 putative membrane protein [[Clostridium] bifermentans ATCC 638] [Paraclostridium bifermentans ATCC 638 = DSM 14991]RIZ57520.1 hypothetical protein CHH45_16125 [Paraclostridium bifermentans]UAG19989.1 hypothetical protein KXZ80_17065 [Paraclostridium bifermentans]
MNFSENKIINFIMKGMFFILAWFSCISIITNNKFIFDVTKVLFVIVALYVCIKVVRDFLKDFKQN